MIKTWRKGAKPPAGATMHRAPEHNDIRRVFRDQD
nr:MAG TPA: hypothetical protein [Caudoviricetes sp.]